MKGYHHLSAADEAEIRRLHAEGKSEKEIGLTLHVHRNTVYRTLRQFGLSLPWRGARSPALTAAQKRQVLRLLKKGMGTVPIAARLGLRQHAVRKFAEESHFQHPAGRYGCRYKIPEETLKKLTAEIQARTNPGIALAEKYPQISYRMLLKLARKILGVRCFRTGRRRSPLESDYPQRHLHVHKEVGHG